MRFVRLASCYQVGPCISGSEGKQTMSEASAEISDGRSTGAAGTVTPAATRWYHLVAYFFGGVFLANTIPHLVNGMSGNPFQSPFATPPGKGLSSSTVNVEWGMFNLAVGYLLVVRVGRFDLKRTWHVVFLGLGALMIALQLARHFGELHGGNL